jgi:phosphohistidine phosphatase SixA
MLFDLLKGRLEHVYLTDDFLILRSRAIRTLETAADVCNKLQHDDQVTCGNTERHVDSVAVINEKEWDGPG